MLWFLWDARNHLESTVRTRLKIANHVHHIGQLGFKGHIVCRSCNVPYSFANFINDHPDTTYKSPGSRTLGPGSNRVSDTRSDICSDYLSLMGKYPLIILTFAGCWADKPIGTILGINSQYKTVRLWFCSNWQKKVSFTLMKRVLSTLAIHWSKWKEGGCWFMLGGCLSVCMCFDELWWTLVVNQKLFIKFIVAFLHWSILPHRIKITFSKFSPSSLTAQVLWPKSDMFGLTLKRKWVTFESTVCKLNDIIKVHITPKNISFPLVLRGKCQGLWTSTISNRDLNLFFTIAIIDLYSKQLESSS